MRAATLPKLHTTQFTQTDNREMTVLDPLTYKIIFFVKLSAESQTNMAPITAVGAAGGVCLLLVIALTIVVIKIKKRFRGAFADRNKVYAMEQRSKYVKEEKDNRSFAQEDEVNGMGEQNVVTTSSA